MLRKCPSYTQDFRHQPANQLWGEKLKLRTSDGAKEVIWIIASFGARIVQGQLLLTATAAYPRHLDVIDREFKTQSISGNDDVIISEFKLLYDSVMSRK